MIKAVLPDSHSHASEIIQLNRSSLPVFLSTALALTLTPVRQASAADSVLGHGSAGSCSEAAFKSSLNEVQATDLLAC